MPGTESERYALREKLTETLGPEPARTLMEHLPPVSWDELATKEDLRQLADRMATKEDLRQLADKMATKEDLRQMADLLRKETQVDLKDIRADLKDVRADLKKMSGELQTQLTVTMTGQHRITMLALLGVFVATAASVLIPLLTSSPA